MYGSGLRLIGASRCRGRHHLHESALQCRDALARKRVRHPDDPGVARASGCEYDDDLLSRSEPGRARRAESGRSARTGSRPTMNPNSIHRYSPARIFRYLVLDIRLRARHLLAARDDPHGSSARDRSFRSCAVPLALKSPACRDTLRPQTWRRAIEFGRLLVRQSPGSRSKHRSEPMQVRSRNANSCVGLAHRRRSYTGFSTRPTTASRSTKSWRSSKSSTARSTWSCARRARSPDSPAPSCRSGARLILSRQLSIDDRRQPALGHQHGQAWRPAYQC